MTSYSYQALADFLAQDGHKYVKPEKAGPAAQDMVALKALGQTARASFTGLAQAVAERYQDLAIQRVSLWANQAQVARAHFWVYFQTETDSLARPLLALRLYGDSQAFGVSCELSIIERHKDEASLVCQNQVLSQPAAAPLYYWAQETASRTAQRYEATNVNRDQLTQAVAAGSIRKVLLREDIALWPNQDQESLLDQIGQGFARLAPFQQVTRQPKKS